MLEGNNISESVLMPDRKFFPSAGGGLVYCLDRVFLQYLDPWPVHHVPFRS